MDREESEFKKLIEKTLRLAEENNRILKKMRRALRWGSFFRFIYWAIIIGTAVGAYYFIQPLLEPLMSTFQNIIDAPALLENLKLPG